MTSNFEPAAAGYRLYMDTKRSHCERTLTRITLASSADVCSNCSSKWLNLEYLRIHGPSLQGDLAYSGPQPWRKDKNSSELSRTTSDNSEQMGRTTSEISADIRTPSSLTVGRVTVATTAPWDTTSWTRSSHSTCCRFKLSRIILKQQQSYGEWDSKDTFTTKNNIGISKYKSLSETLSSGYG